jgi:hypothetical protein
MTGVCLILESDAGREALLRAAEAGLREGECLVKIVDIIGLRRSVRTTPKDKRAELVARELPLVLRGGLTSLVSYYKVPTQALDATETHGLNGEITHTYEVMLNIARVGVKGATVLPA